MLTSSRKRTLKCKDMFMAKIISKNKTNLRLHAAPVLLGLVTLTMVMIFTT